MQEEKDVPRGDQSDSRQDQHSFGGVPGEPLSIFSTPQHQASYKTRHRLLGGPSLSEHPQPAVISPATPGLSSERQFNVTAGQQPAGISFATPGLSSERQFNVTTGHNQLGFLL